MYSLIFKESNELLATISLDISHVILKLDLLDFPTGITVCTL